MILAALVLAAVADVGVVSVTPGKTEVRYDETFTQEELSQLLPLEGLEPLRVEIEPVTPGVRLWAFVSVTNNDTHHVTVVTPQ